MSKTIEVEVDLSDFDDDDIMDEAANILSGLIKNKSNRSAEKLKKLVQPFIDEFEEQEHNGLKVNTLDDRLKMDHLLTVWHKYNSTQLETLLPYTP